MKITAKNGGYVKYIDRENGNRHKYYYLQGNNEIRTFQFHFDTVTPFQSCAETGQTDCQLLTAPNLVTSVTI